MNYLLQITPLSLLIFIIVSHASYAQYTVAPNAFVITDPSRSTEMLVRLSADASAMEFELSSFFAVPHTDSSGSFVLLEPRESYLQDVSSKIRFSPRRFVLNSGEQQIVRITVVDEHLPVGEYWSRVVVSAKSASQGLLGPEQGLSVSMGLEIRTISGLLYRKGPLRTDIEVSDLASFMRNDSLIVDIDVRKGSSAAWIGTATISLVNETSQEALALREPANFYLAGRYRLAFPLPTLPPGTHQAKLALTTTRDDPTLPLIKANDVIITFPLVIHP